MLFCYKTQRHFFRGDRFLDQKHLWLDVKLHEYLLLDGDGRPTNLLFHFLENEFELNYLGLRILCDENNMAVRHKVLQLLKFDGQDSLVAKKRWHVYLQVTFHCFLLLKFKSVCKVH